MRVICRDNPVSMQRREIDLPDGLTITDYAARSEMPGEIWSHGVATLGSETFLPETWSRVRPKRGSVLGLAIVPQGPAAAIVANAVSLIGKGALNVFGKDGGIGKPGKPFEDRNLGEAGVGDNVLARYEQIPSMLGRMWVSPRQLAPPYVEYLSDTVIIRAIYGFSGRHEVHDVRVNGASTADQNGITTNIRDGDPSNDPPSIYTKAVWQQEGWTPQRHVLYSGSGKLLQHTKNATDVETYDLPKEYRVRLGNSPDRVIVDVEFPNGLYAVDRSLTSAARQSNVPFRLVLYKQDGTTFVLPELHVRADAAYPVRAKLVIEFSADPGTGVPLTDHQAFWSYAFCKTTAMDTVGTTADSYFGTSKDADYCYIDAVVDGSLPSGYRTQSRTLTIYIDPASLPKDAFDLGITVGSFYRNDRLNTTTLQYAYNGGSDVDPKHFSYHTVSSNQNAMEDQDYSVNVCKILAVTSEWDTEPLDAEGLATVEVEAIGITIDKLAVDVERIVDKKWNAGTETWDATPGPSSNPAELTYHVLTSASENEFPVDSTLISASLGEWAEWCSSNGRECNAMIDSGSVEDALAICFAAGQAMPIFDGTYGAVIEKDRTAEAPEIIYTPRNSRGFTAERSYEKLPQALLCTFNDEDDYNEPREIVVPYDGYSADTATRLEALDLKGTTAETAVETLALLALRKRYLRRKRYSFETDASYLISTKGSLIGVKHDFLDTQLSYARIVAVHRNSANEIVGITTDAILTMNSGGGDIYSVTDIYAEPDIYSIGASTGIAMLALDGTVVLGVTSQAYDTRDITFTSALAADSDIQPGCIVVSGTVDSEFRRMIVESIEPAEIGDEGATARIVCYDEVPALFD